jgi:hypothetical protein
LPLSLNWLEFPVAYLTTTTSYQHMMLWFAVSAKAYVVVSCRKPYYISPQGRLEKANPSNSKK